MAGAALPHLTLTPPSSRGACPLRPQGRGGDAAGDTMAGVRFGAGVASPGSMADQTDRQPNEDITSDHLLGGRVSYAQPRHGLRATIDPILLAAAIPAQPGEQVLEGGAGAGAAILCLAARVSGMTGVGVDR